VTEEQVVNKSRNLIYFWNSFLQDDIFKEKETKISLHKSNGLAMHPSQVSEYFTDKEY
jgi:hypothetical protein